MSLKRLFEQKYPQGYFLTKRAEEPPADKDKTQIIDLVDLGKYLISCHSQRPNIAYSETKIFDKYFEQLFHREYEYDPENAQALNLLMQEIMKRWTDPDNPFGLNESLPVMKAYAPYHVLYAISQFFAIASNHSDRVPSPKSAYKKATDNRLADKIFTWAATCVNIALESAANEQQSADKIFSPQNWIKAKTSLNGIKIAVNTQLTMLPTFQGGKELKEALVLPTENFEYRWEAD